MKNITIAVPEEVYRRARVHAARQQTSIRGLVAGYLTSLPEEKGDFERRKELQNLLLSQVGKRKFRAAGRLKREDAYDRNALR